MLSSPYRASFSSGIVNSVKQFEGMTFCFKYYSKVVFNSLLINVAFVLSSQFVVGVAKFQDHLTAVQAQEIEIRRDNRSLKEVIEGAAPSKSDVAADFKLALEAGNEATEKSKAAYSRYDWEQVTRQFLRAIDLLEQVSRDPSQRDKARQKISEYQAKLNDSTERLLTISEGGGGMVERLPANNIVPAYQQEQTQYDIWTLNHRKNTLQLSFYSSIAIFLLVVVIVVVGLYLSYLQLLKGLSSETKLVVKEGTLEVSSAIIGFLILLLSLAFFYLYLREVYPIHEIGTTTEKNADGVNEN